MGPAEPPSPNRTAPLTAFQEASRKFDVATFQTTVSVRVGQGLLDAGVVTAGDSDGQAKRHDPALHGRNEALFTLLEKPDDHPHPGWGHANLLRHLSIGVS